MISFVGGNQSPGYNNHNDNFNASYKANDSNNEWEHFDGGFDANVNSTSKLLQNYLYYQLSRMFILNENVRTQRKTL